MGRTVGFKLHLPALSGGGSRLLTGTAKVVSSRQQGGLHRVSFAFEAMPPADREHLDIALIDFVLRRFNLPG